MMHTPMEFFNSEGQSVDMYSSRCYANYDDDDILMYQFGVGPPPPLHYSAVQLSDVEITGGDDLLDLETVVRYDELTDWGRCDDWRNPNISHIGYGNSNGASLGYTPSSFYNDKSNDGRASKFLMKSQSNGFINPSSGSVFCSDDPIKLMFTSKLANDDVEAWRYFGSKGLHVYGCGEKIKPSSFPLGRRQLIQKFRAVLKPECDLGFCQFFQSAKQGIENSRGQFAYGTVATYFFYRGPESRLDKEVYPLLLSVLPRARQTYVPMQQHQLIQLILPQSYNVDTWHQIPEVPLRPYGAYSSSSVGRINCHYFEYVQDVADGYPIFYASRDTNRQGAVIIPPIEKRHGMRFAVLHAPMKHLVIYPNGVDGIIFRTIENVFKGRHSYLDRSYLLRIESHYRLVLDSDRSAYNVCVRITNKSVTQLEISDLFDGNACKAQATKTG